MVIYIVTIIIVLFCFLSHNQVCIFCHVFFGFSLMFIVFYSWWSFVVFVFIIQIWWQVLNVRYYYLRPWILNQKKWNPLVNFNPKILDENPELIGLLTVNPIIIDDIVYLIPLNIPWKKMDIIRYFWLFQE